jgi:hypothetical protein
VRSSFAGGAGRCQVSQLAIGCTTCAATAQCNFSFLCKGNRGVECGVHSIIRYYILANGQWRLAQKYQSSGQPFAFTWHGSAVPESLDPRCRQHTTCSMQAAFKLDSPFAQAAAVPPAKSPAPICTSHLRVGAVGGS